MNVWNTNRFSDRFNFRRHPGPAFDPNRAYISDCEFIEHYKNEILKLTWNSFYYYLKSSFQICLHVIAGKHQIFIRGTKCESIGKHRKLDIKLINIKLLCLILNYKYFNVERQRKWNTQVLYLIPLPAWSISKLHIFLTCCLTQI